METVTGENGNTATKQKTIFGIPCQDCTNRAEIMGAGNWKVDAIVLGTIAFLILGIVLYKASLVDE